MEQVARQAAREAIGFMPEAEGLALHGAALAVDPQQPMLEIGSYCGKSSVYLGCAARDIGTILYSIDHHRGSEEHQQGEEYHDERVVDEDGRIDTLPEFRRTIARAGLEKHVIGIVGDSSTVASYWKTPLSLVFIDGGHSMAAALNDYEGWAPHLIEGGLLAIHDVFEDPAEGGRPPFEIYERALASGAFEEIRTVGSLRVLRRI